MSTRSRFCRGDGGRKSKVAGILPRFFPGDRGSRATTDRDGESPIIPGEDLNE
jgi:hypothetical protein